MSTPLTGWARLLVHSLAGAGVTDVVVSPGSRSTPFLAAAHEHPALRLWTVTDERAAGFFALGQGRFSGRPSLLLCTSGTAGAHYLPAVIEAEMAAVPLLVLTADRPAELVDCGAAQTVDQIGLYGRHVRSFVELGTPESHPEALRGLRRRAVQAVFDSRWPEAGAVHLNARARKPLEPEEAGRTGGEPFPLDEILAEPVPGAHAAARDPSPEAVESLAAAVREESSGLIVCGAAGLAQRCEREAVLELARRSGYPVVAEAASQLRFTGVAPPGLVRVENAASLFECPALRARFRPRVVLQIGRAPLSPAWETMLLEAPECRRFVLTENAWHDPQNRATALVFGDLGRTLEAVGRRLEGLERGPTAWALALAEADAEVGTLVEAEACGGGELEEGTVTRLAVETLPGGALLALGNSLPIRQVERFAAGIDTDLRVWAQRGANGIDGLVSGVLGTLSLAQESPAAPPCALLLLGDLSLLHDLGGLALARLCRLPLLIVVVNNDGGRIFEQLPIAGVPGTDLELWTTPHGLDFEAAARLFHLPYSRAATSAALRAALAEARERPGATLIEARVDPHSALRQSEALRRAVSERLGR